MFSFHSITHSCPIFHFLIEDTVFYLLYILASFVREQVTISVWVYLWASYSVPLIYIFVPNSDTKIGV